jgi:hypothetical protein
MNDYSFAVHRVKVGDKERDVNCLRDYKQPIEDCPFCAAGLKANIQVYLPLYDVDSGEVKIWPRGPRYIQKVTGLCGRYKNMVSHIFEIERNGKANSMQTTYENYEQEKDDTTLEDLPDVPEILGSFVMDKTAEDMEAYLEEGEFPEESVEAPVRRRAKSEPEEDEDEEELEEEEERPRRRRTEERRTPSRSTSRRVSSKEDKF